jgi:hypothetical protein
MRKKGRRMTRLFYHQLEQDEREEEEEKKETFLCVNNQAKEIFCY